MGLGVKILMGFTCGCSGTAHSMVACISCLYRLQISGITVPPVLSSLNQQALSALHFRCLNNLSLVQLSLLGLLRVCSQVQGLSLGYP